MQGLSAFLAPLGSPDYPSGKSCVPLSCSAPRCCRTFVQWKRLWPAKTILVDPGACVSHAYDKEAERCKGPEGEEYNTVGGDQPEQPLQAPGASAPGV